MKGVYYYSYVEKKIGKCELKNTMPVSVPNHAYWYDEKMERSFCLSAETAFGGITRRRGLWSECRLPRKRIYQPYFWIHTEGLGCRSIIKVFIATTAKDG